MTASAPRRLVCERCGAAFACLNGGDPGACWCAGLDVRLPLPDPAAPGAYADCLCPDCLRSAAAAGVRPVKAG